MLTTAPITNGGDQRVDRLALVVEDDDGARLLLVKSLEREGFSPLQAANVHEATEMLERHPVSIVLLDLGLPDGSGLEFLRARRDAGDQTPVIIVSGWGDSADKVAGLRLGADDYLAKPFSGAELAARVEALVRRSQRTPALDALAFGDVEIDPMAREVRIRGELVDLRPREYDLLAYLVSHPRRAFSRDDLLHDVWGSSAEWQQVSTVTEHIRKIRLVVEPDPVAPRYLVTVRGVGYRFDP
ncbi:MAG: response regulator transcription factor [Acidimicrobiia bacterium]